MADQDLIRRRIRRLERLIEGGGDDPRATKRAALAVMYEALGDRANASAWYLAAVRHACRSEEFALKTIVYARRAVHADPENEEAKAELRKLNALWGIDKEESKPNDE